MKTLVWLRKIIWMTCNFIDIFNSIENWLKRKKKKTLKTLSCSQCEWSVSPCCNQPHQLYWFSSHLEISGWGERASATMLFCLHVHLCCLLSVYRCSNNVNVIDLAWLCWSHSPTCELLCDYSPQRACATKIGSANTHVMTQEHWKYRQEEIREWGVSKYLSFFNRQFTEQH